MRVHRFLALVGDFRRNGVDVVGVHILLRPAVVVHGVHFFERLPEHRAAEIEIVGLLEGGVGVVVNPNARCARGRAIDGQNNRRLFADSLRVGMNRPEQLAAVLADYAYALFLFPDKPQFGRGDFYYVALGGFFARVQNVHRYAVRSGNATVEIERKVPRRAESHARGEQKGNG